jgi:leader peptidase (prepilin peptidase)/N-methyltransferase
LIEADVILFSPPVLDVLFFVLGAIIGSFLNVCIYRIPADRSIVRPGSRCPVCGGPIAGYDNIPLVSYLLLRGRCRKCGCNISIRYPLVELLTAALFVVFSRVLGLSIELPVTLAFACLLIAASFIDLDHMIIPDVLSVGGLLFGVALSFVRPSFGSADSLGSLLAGAGALKGMPAALERLATSLGGVLAGGGVLYAIAASYELVRKKEGMGGGDIKLLGMIGAFCGIEGVIFSLVIGSFIGAAVGIPLMLIKRRSMTYALPFGPFLSLGALVYAILYVVGGRRSLFHGNELIRLLFSVVPG